MTDDQKNDAKPEAHSVRVAGQTVVGTIAVTIKPGASRRTREGAVREALAADLSKACEALGVVAVATPISYTKERPGRDAQGRTVFDVRGAVEGDVLVPAVSGRQ